MKNQTENQKPLLVKISEQLLKDQQELDSLAVQLSLGKSEAKDKLVEVKAELKQKVNQLKSAISNEYEENLEWAKDTIVKLDEFEGKLADNAEEIFEESKKNILMAVKDIESEMQKNPAAQKASILFTTYSEKAKIQLDILEKNIQGKKLETKESYEEGINDAKEKINDTIERLKEKKEEADLKLDTFKKEIDLVYVHLKKAVSSFK